MRAGNWTRSLCPGVPALALILAGCGSAPLARPVAESAPAAPEIEAASLSISNCQRVGDKAFDLTEMALVDELAGLAVDSVVKLGKALLEDAQRKRNAVWSATGVVDTCFPKQEKDEWRGILHVRRAVLDGGGEVVQQPGFDLTGEVRFLRIKAGNDDKIAVRFQAKRLVYGRTAAPTRGRGRKHVILLVSLTENAILGAKPAEGNEQITAPIRIDLGWLRDGFTYSAAQLAHIQAAALVDAPTADRFLGTAIVLETEDELLALKVLTEAYGEHEDSLSEALKKLLAPTKK